MIKLSDIVKEMNGEDLSFPLDRVSSVSEDPSEMLEHIKDQLRTLGGVAFDSGPGEYWDFELREVEMGGQKKIARATFIEDQYSEEDEEYEYTETRFSSIWECIKEGIRLNYFAFAPDIGFIYDDDREDEIFNWMDK